MLLKSVLLIGLTSSCQHGSVLESRSGSDGLGTKWQAQRELKASMMDSITDCLITRRRSMQKSQQEALVKTDW